MRGDRKNLRSSASSEIHALDVARNTEIYALDNYGAKRHPPSSPNETSLRT